MGIVYTFSHEKCEGVEFYAERKHVNMKNQGREEELFQLIRGRIRLIGARFLNRSGGWSQGWWC